jgi:hypothetical protein
MTDWYFAGMFDEMFWAQVGKQRIIGRGAAEVLRQLIAEAGDGDLTWLLRASMLDALCRAELAFEIKRRDERVQWVLNPFRDRPDASGYADTIGEANRRAHQSRVNLPRRAIGSDGRQPTVGTLFMGGRNTRGA